jgi:NodT family efflux transporter outer membrane factor (OMF) lipoprotein
MVNRNCIIALSFATLLSACDLTNPYESPAIPDFPERFSESTETNADAWPDQQWWKDFGSDELTTLIEEARVSNKDIGAAIARIRQADAQTRISGAPLLPTIDANASAEHAAAPNPSSPKRRITGNTYSVGVSASYEIDFWGKNRSASDAADALRDASIYDQQTVLLTVTASVANLYFDTLATAERIAIAEQNLAASEKLLAALNRRFAAGVNSKLDLAQQENITATQRAALPTLQLRLTQNRNALAVLLGKMPESMQRLQTNVSAITLPTIPQGIPSELLQRRPDVQAAEANLISAHADINAARAAFFPSLSLTSGANVVNSSLGNLFNPAGQLLTVSGNLLQPIFAGGALEGTLDLSEARADERTQLYQKAILSAFADVENALAAVTRASETEAAQKQAEQSAREAFDLTQRQFEGGIIDITTVLNTQRSLFTASDAYIQSKLARLQALVDAYKALGGGWLKANEQ